MTCDASSLRGCVVLVTGGTGLVGKALQNLVEKEGVKEGGGELGRWVFLGSADGDLCDWTATESVFAKHAPTHVIHLAARVGGLFANMSSNLDFLRDNLRMNDNVLQSCIKHRVKLVSCLSTCIFPDKPPGSPITSDMIHAGAPHPSNEGYAYAKRMLEVQSRLSRSQTGCDFVTVVPTNVYGPHDNFSLSTSHVLPGLLHKALLAKNNRARLTVAGTGTPLRQFIFAPDLARLLLWVLRFYSSAEPLILSVPESCEVSIADAAAMVAEAVGLEEPLVFDASLADGQHKKTASCAKLQQLLPDFEFTPIGEGLRLTARWLEEAYPHIRQ